MKKLYLLLILVLSFGCTKTDFSQDVAPEPDQPSYKISVDSLKQQALELQAIFGDETTKSRTLSVKNVASINQVLFIKGFTKSVNSDPETPQAYVVNFADEAGFAILADDKRMVNNVLAYSEDGNIDATVDNPGLLMFLEEANSYLGVVGSGFNPMIPPKFLPMNYEPNRNIKPSNWGVESQGFVVWSYRGGMEVARKDKLLSVNWGQRSPYNLDCPIISGTVCPTGCVATAAVQIMSYYKQPTSITLNGVNYPINWTLAFQGSIASSNISKLMRDFGNKVGMDYTPGSSGAPFAWIPSALRQYGYTSSSGSKYNINTILDEIHNSRPVCVSGHQKDVYNSGHAWVVDGYLLMTTDYTSVIDYVNDDSYWEPNNVYQVGQRFHENQSHSKTYLHCNWGWNGDRDGYFLDFDLTSKGDHIFDEPSDNDAKTANFNDDKSMIYNIKY